MPRRAEPAGSYARLSDQITRVLETRGVSLLEDASQRQRMVTMTTMKYCLSAAAGALALGLATMTAQAAPAAGTTTDLKAAAGTETSVDKVAYRRCWWHHGHRHCRWYGGGDYYPYYGYGPSVGFYWGGHRHHRHHHHR